MLRLKGVIFDLDGTVVDVPYDWSRIKKKLATQGKPILHFIHNLKEPEKTEKLKVLEKYEKKATLQAVLKEGMLEFLDLLKEKGIKKALVTNNSKENVLYILNKFKLEFDCLITRESGLWKPSGDPIITAVKELGLKKEECCVVGDSHFDIQAAKEAGIRKVFILNDDKERFNSTSVEVFKDVESLKMRIKQLL